MPVTCTGTSNCAVAANTDCTEASTSTPTPASADFTACAAACVAGDLASIYRGTTCECYTACTAVTTSFCAY